MCKRYVLTIVLCLAVATLGAQAPTPVQFLSGVTVGENVLDVKIVDAVRRADQQWLTFGSRTTSGPNGRETAVLVRRAADGAPVEVRELVIDGGLSYRPMSLAAVGPAGDVIALGVEYDIGGNRGLSMTRLDPALTIVWSVRLELASGVFEWARLVAREAAEDFVMVGEVRRSVGGALDNGDRVLATVHGDGTVSDVRTLGVAADHERIVDVRPFGAEGSMLALVEMARQRPSGSVESGDGLVVIDGEGTIAKVEAIGHAMAAGVRARPLHLLDRGDGGWVVAGRRTAFWPNVFYLHGIAPDVTPDAFQTLIPFFNVIDVDAGDGDIWVYGEANGEIMDTGTVLMRFDAGLQMVLQRRYGTENHVFPSGAFAFSASGALLALGARRISEEGFAYEFAQHVVLPSGEGVNCDEGDYAGFAPVADRSSLVTGWQPTARPLAPTTSAVSAATVAVSASKVDLCVRE